MKPQIEEFYDYNRIVEMVRQTLRDVLPDQSLEDVNRNQFTLTSDTHEIHKFQATDAGNVMDGSNHPSNEIHMTYGGIGCL